MNIVLVLHKYNLPLDDPCCYPLGYMYVSAKYKAEGHRVKVLNYNLWDYDLREEIKGFDLVGFTGFEEFLPYIKRDAAICKDMGIKTILGGALATFLPKDMSQIVDEVVEGEFEDGTLLPDYEGFGIEEYKSRQQHFHMGILSSRGCPFHCTFCAQTCRYSERNLDEVFWEIDLYRAKYGCDAFIFNDNTLNVTKSRFLEICNGMKDRGQWGAAIRPDVFDDEMAKTAKECGALYFIVGVESFNQDKLDRMNKKTKVEDIYICLDLLNKYNIDYHGNILFGFEGETHGDIVTEMDTLASLAGRYKIYPAMVQPFIGTKNGKLRSIDSRTYEFFNSAFKEYIISQGKYLYPELEVV